MRVCCTFLFLIVSICHSYVWEGRYQFFQADSIQYRFLNGTSLQFVEDTPSRSWPNCFECLRDEIALPLLSAVNTSLQVRFYFGADVSLFEDGYSVGNSNSPKTHAGFQSITLTHSVPGGTQSIRINPPEASHPFVAMIPEGYDGYACEHLEYGMSIRDRDGDGWIVDSLLEAENVVFGAFQDEGYCPSTIFHPCPPSEQCLIANGTIACLPRGPTSFPEDRSLIKALGCTEPAPPPTQGPSEYELSPMPSEGLRLHSSTSFLQAARYNFTINETTQVRFPESYADVSDQPYEIWRIWDEEGQERRLNLQFTRKTFSNPFNSKDGWTLDVNWVYDNTEDWTEWNLHELISRPAQIIEVPKNFSFFQCEYVEFNYESIYTGGQPARMVWEDLVMGAFLLPEHQVCELDIYHPCNDDQVCRAIDGNVTCMDPLVGVGDGSTVGRSAPGKRRVPGCVRIANDADNTQTPATSAPAVSTPMTSPPTTSGTVGSTAERPLFFSMVFLGFGYYLLS